MSKTVRSPPNKFSKLAVDEENPGPSPNTTSPTGEKTLKKTGYNRPKRLRPAGEEYNDLDLFKHEMKDMLTSMFTAFSTKQNERISAMEKHIAEVKMFTSPIVDIEKSVSFVSEQLGDVQAKIDRLEGDRNAVRHEIAEIHETIHKMEKQTKKTCVEIRNVPKRQKEKKEDLFNMVKSLLSTLEVEFTTADIRDVYRVPNKANNNSSSLVAEFTSTLTKGTVLDKARRYNIRAGDSKLSSSHLGLTDSQPIYISELLTAKCKRLHYLARELARSDDYTYCWTSNGNIYLRKREGMPQILVKSETQLQALKAGA